MKEVPTQSWLSEAIYGEADSFFDALITELDHASTSIDVEMYIFENDDLGRRIISRLAAAARRGVRVRVLVDGIGSPDWMGEPGKLLEESGAETRVYHPAPWSLFRHIGLWKKSEGFFALIRGMNRRDHRKICVIDGRVAWIGSMNVSAVSLRSLRGAERWHECGVRVEGGDVAVLTAAFDYAWDRVLDPLARFTNRALQKRRVALFRTARLVRVNVPRSIRRRNLRDLLMRIRTAHERVWIETPYFVPTPRLVRALLAAAKSGADVRLILPSRSDVFFMPWVILIFIDRLMQGRMSIFAYGPATLHAKIMIVDDWATIGSSNLNHRSLIHDLEVDAVITSPAARRALDERFRSDLEHSVKVTSKSLEEKPRLEKFLGRLLIPLRYWM